jgi:hypothetical protein
MPSRWRNVVKRPVGVERDRPPRVANQNVPSESWYADMTTSCASPSAVVNRVTLPFSTRDDSAAERADPERAAAVLEDREDAVRPEPVAPAPRGPLAVRVAVEPGAHRADPDVAGAVDGARSR